MYKVLVCPICFKTTKMNHIDSPMKQTHGVQGSGGSSTNSRFKVQIPASPVYMLECPSARYWTPNCSRWLRQRCVNGLMWHVVEKHYISTDHLPFKVCGPNGNLQVGPVGKTLLHIFKVHLETRNFFWCTHQPAKQFLYDSGIQLLYHIHDSGLFCNVDEQGWISSTPRSPWTSLPPTTNLCSKLLFIFLTHSLLQPNHRELQSTDQSSLAQLSDDK